MPYYLQSTVRLKFGELGRYSAMMDELVPHMARLGWKLVMALQPMVGELTHITHIWEIERFNDIADALERCFSDPATATILAASPSIVDTEFTQIMVKTSYSG